jgi:hypothetical protein
MRLFGINLELALHKRCRRIAASVFFCITILLGGFGHSAEAQDWSRVRAQSKGSILFLKVIVRNRDGTNEHVASTASGFIVSKNGHFLTAAHVIQNPDPNTNVIYFAAIGPRDSQQFELNFIKSDADLDIALFQLPPSQAWIPLKIASSSNVPDDAKLFVLGFPRGENLSSGEGMLRNRFAKGGRFQTSLPLNYGDSGAPVFDIAGRVIGLAEGGYDEANMVTNVVPADFFAPLLPLTGEGIGHDIKGDSSSDTKKLMVRREPFSFTVDSEDQKTFEQTFCMAQESHIQAIDVSTTSQNGNGTHIISALPTTDRPNCAILRVYVAGNGVDRIGGIIVNHKGRGWLSGNLNISYN